MINNTKNKILTLRKVIRGTPKLIYSDSSQRPFVLHL